MDVLVADVDVIVRTITVVAVVVVRFASFRPGVVLVPRLEVVV